MRGPDWVFGTGLTRSWIFVCVVGFLLVTHGCASVPISTLLKLRGFDQAQFISLNASELRAAILSEPYVAVDQSRIKIDVALTYSDQHESLHHFTTAPTSEADPLAAGLDSSPPSLKCSIFALTSSGLEDFRGLQKEVGTMQVGRIDKIAITVDARGAFTPSPPSRPFDLEMWLRLKSTDGYLQMLKRTRIDPDQSHH